MADLISRAAALEALGECPYNWNDWPEEIQAVDDWESHKEAIENIPAVNAVPVVRCRDCKYWEMQRTAYGIKYGYCNNMHSHVSSHRMPEENYYCPHGERRYDDGSAD